MVDAGLSYYKNNLNADNWIYGNTTADKYRLDIFADTIRYNQTSCPIDRPYVNYVTKLCFNCPVGLVFNLGTKLCDGCREGFKYNITINQCIGICPPNLVFNVTTNNCVVPQQNYNNNASACPP